MANPYKGQSASTVKSKFGNMGQPVALAKHADEADKKQVKKLAQGYDLKAPGYAAGGRLDKYARGGRTKTTTINIDMRPREAPPPPPPPPAPPPVAAAPPPPPPAPPAAGGGANPNQTMPPAPIPSPMTGAPPPMPQPAPNAGNAMPRFRRGGAVKYIPGKPTDNGLKRWAQYARRNSYVKGG